MSTSPVDPDDVRAAAEVHRELGPDFSDAVVAAFIDRVDRAVAARVEARLAEERQRQPIVRDRNRRTLVKGVALGVCAGALVAGVGITHSVDARQSQPQSVFAKPHLEPGKGVLGPAQGELKPVPRPIKPPPPAGPPPVP